mgnify:CR=1 FL=1|tara:strand:+ start:711 stop:1622 length:912 start_codon:yes stop_codon:yes gene_type:complete
MSKTYLFAAFLLAASFTGCVEDAVEPESELSLEASINDLFNSINNKDFLSYCSYLAYNIVEVENIIVLANSTELEKCAAEMEEIDDYQSKVTFSNYTEENLDYRVTNNSGFVYSVTIIIETCERKDEFEPWDCSDPGEMELLWVQIGKKWIWWMENYWSVDPIATFYVSQDSSNVYHVEVIKVSRQDPLEDFSFYLKDESGLAYLDGNGFGEIAMQIKNGEEHGINMAYSGDDDRLERRANNVSNDDGSEYPVHFSDNDRDGKLSSGDQFLVYGPDAGPAEDNWKLDIQYDITGNIIGSAKLL